MIRGFRLCCAIAGIMALAGCASAPVHYHTLVPPVSDAVAVAASSLSLLSFELAPVTIPSQVDQPQLVVRKAATSVAVLDGERWIAPLADEVRAALSADLVGQWGGQDLSGLPHAGQQVLSIRVELRRFDSVLDQEVLLDAAWSVRPGRDLPPRSCTSQIQQAVAPGYQALVQGHQQALATLAARIAVVARGGACR